MNNLSTIATDKKLISKTDVLSAGSGVFPKDLAKRKPGKVVLQQLSIEFCVYICLVKLLHEVYKFLPNALLKFIVEYGSTLN